MPESTVQYSIEQVYNLYKKHSGIQTAVLKDKACPFKSKITMQKIVKEHGFKQRLNREYAELTKLTQREAVKQVKLDTQKLTDLKEALIIKIMNMAEKADVEDPKNIYGLKAAWEILRTELNLPTTISQNANLNLDAYLHRNRSLEEIDADIADFATSAEDASPKPPA